MFVFILMEKIYTFVYSLCYYLINIKLLSVNFFIKNYIVPL